MTTKPPLARVLQGQVTLLHKIFWLMDNKEAILRENKETQELFLKKTQS